MDREQIDRFVKRLIGDLGGAEQARRRFDDEHMMLVKRWEQDTASIGRILRAHLFVEHFMRAFIQRSNPNLGAIDDARITFSQMIALLKQGDPQIDYLIPGIRQLNKVRNRLAHNLQSVVTADDAQVFLNIALFRELRNALAQGQSTGPSQEPIDVLEDFARHAGISLQHAVSELSSLFSKAVAE